MSKDLKISVLNPGKKHFYLFAGIIAVCMFLMSGNAAINIDEILHYNHAKKVISWYETLGNDTSCLNTPKSNLKYYGQSVDNISALINRVFSIGDEYQTRHYVGFVFSSLLILITGLIAYELTGNYLTAIVAMILLFISPRPMGQAFGNLKDMPFAMAYALCILITIRLFKEMPHPRWKTTIFLGLAIAFTNSIRIGGLVLFPYLLLFFIGWLIIFRKSNISHISDTRWWKGIILKVFTVVAIGYFASLVFWPYGLLNPIKNPLEALSVMEHYKISIKQIFEGAQTWSTNLPWYYLAKWMLISIPEIILIGIVLYLIACCRQVKRANTSKIFFNALVVFTFLFPFIYVVIINSNLYSGWRQMYFIYTPLVITSAVGIVFIFQKLKKTMFVVASGLAIVLIALPLVHSARNFPSEYIYFNSLAKIGNKNIWGNYEYDYYWHEMKKAANWMEEELGSNSNKVKLASNFDLRAYLFDKDFDFKYLHFYDKISTEWDYAVLGVNYVHPYQLKNNTWKPAGVIKTFYHNGNPTVVIIKGQDKNAQNGYNAFIKHNYSNAIKFLDKAKEWDNTDLNIRAYLGESYLALNNFEKVGKEISEGKKLHPYYEPFLLLDAKLEIKQKNYTKGLELLRHLFYINPRYFKALPYLIECYENTGDKDKADELKKIYKI